MYKNYPMKNIYVKLALMALLIIPFINACQKEELMMSEGKVNEQIAYTWSQEFTPAESKVTWKFSEGNVYTLKNEKATGQGTYKVDCSLTKAKIKIEGFTGGNDFMNNTWQVIKLDDHILVLTNIDKGTMVYEFTRSE
jgi:hypothetical protein